MDVGDRGAGERVVNSAIYVLRRKILDQVLISVSLDGVSGDAGDGGIQEVKRNGGKIINGTINTVAGKSGGI